MWLHNGGEDTPVEEAETLPDGTLRVFYWMWVHDCLDVDIASGRAVHRSQGGLASDDPTDWTTTLLQLRRIDGRWCAEITAQELNDWAATVADTIGKRKAAIERFPALAQGLDVASLEQAQRYVATLVPGWVPIATTIGAELDRVLTGARP